MNWDLRPPAVLCRLPELTARQVPQLDAFCKAHLQQQAAVQTAWSCDLHSKLLHALHPLPCRKKVLQNFDLLWLKQSNLVWPEGETTAKQNFPENYSESRALHNPSKEPLCCVRMPSQAGDFPRHHESLIVVQLWRLCLSKWGLAPQSVNTVVHSVFVSA